MFKLKHGLFFGVTAAILTTVAAGLAADNTTISGAGATFPYPVYAKWADAYSKETNVKLNYQAIGSGGGIKQITEGTVDFGASDAPLKPEELDKAGLVQFPVVMGGVVPVINIAGVKAGELKLTPELLAEIFLGHVKKWNDPKIAGGQSRAQAARHGDYRRPPIRRIGNDLDLHQLPDQGQPRLGKGGRQRQIGLVADRRRRQGQPGCGVVRAADQRRHRLRRVGLRHARTTSRTPSSRITTARSSTRPTTACRPRPRAPTGSTPTDTTWS